jgi:hypothetical protein
MARSYAGVLGTLACGMILTRGLIAGGGLESTVPMACVALFGFAALGWIAGQLAQRFTQESVRTRFQAALASLEADTKKSRMTAK